jgi:hypothetical protein
MDQLLSIPTLSIAELRKVLSDNDINDTSTSRPELIQLVSDTILTNMMLDELQQESAKELQEAEELSKVVEQERVDRERALRQHQDQEYQESVHLDSLTDFTPTSNVDVYESPVPISTTCNSGDLSPDSLRAARIERFE